jgi:hypothetical protein
MKAVTTAAATIRSYLSLIAIIHFVDVVSQLSP